jgi:hypothetical protein
MQCVSPLSKVLPTYIRMQVQRTCKMRAEEWNSNARVVIEHNEKMLLNQMADEGAALHQTSNVEFDSYFEDTLGETTESRARVIRQQAAKAGFPENTHLFVLPKNHSTRSVDTVEGPNGMQDNEMEFQRAICFCMGIPCNLIIQQYEKGKKSIGGSVLHPCKSMCCCRENVYVIWVLE